MGQFVSALFGGGGNASAQAAADAARQRELSSIATARQEQEAQDQSAKTNGELGQVGKTPRGRRLLLSNESGGLGSTLGTA
ncbi:hypothetical protein M2322_003027 [Rhodoblastus acidophilus]|uniref:hypothetical protein n=1 Tax=Rhodoblastus acidophilus TaxID=1074 RepID=UPI002225319C|nr:hypothetical protein [Rhodoblastus acidophilus]MCW2317468.1 hypothetical protein [Rhodoblastus acidophilus]